MKIDKTAVRKVLNKKNFIMAFLALAIIIIAVGYFMYINSVETSNKACIADKTCFDIEIADTLALREKGFSGRESLGNNSGMLFVFQQEETPGFWMKDMNFSLDIIWIDKDFKIIGIEKNLQPCIAGSQCPAVYPNQKVMYVLEINSGLSDAFGFRKNDSVYF